MEEGYSFRFGKRCSWPEAGDPWASYAFKIPLVQRCVLSLPLPVPLRPPLRRQGEVSPVQTLWPLRSLLPRQDLRAAVDLGFG